MANIDVQEAQAWCETTKLNLGTALDGELEASITSQVLTQVAQVFDTSSWVDNTTTPKLIRSIISMYYVAWIYDRTYAEDSPAGSRSYADKLKTRADSLLEAIMSGNVTLPEATPTVDTGSPYFYPTDSSSALPADDDDTSLGPEKFTMGVIW
jgi:hypothetical protein